jgi:hypothetical protein
VEELKALLETRLRVHEAERLKKQQQKLRAEAGKTCTLNNPPFIPKINIPLWLTCADVSRGVWQDYSFLHPPAPRSGALSTFALHLNFYLLPTSS